MSVMTSGWGRAVGGLIFAVVLLVVGLPGDASAQRQELKLPFRAGAVQVNFDETYFGTQPHPTNGAIAFDMSVVPHDPNAEILAIGDGRVRLACTHRSGASILLFQATGYVGDFIYVHLEESSLPPWMSSDWSPVNRGDVIGRMYPNAIEGRVGDACLQFSTGAHLHLDLPELGLMMDGVQWDEDFPNDFEQLVSTNGLSGPDSAVCDGLDATIIGTPGDDRLTGTDGPDVIAGLQGNDTIFALGGDDVVCGGVGNDVIYGGSGFDVIFGAQGNDVIYGANGDRVADHADVLGGRYFGGAGNDFIFGTDRWDRMQGGAGDDSLFGYAGRDWMRGGANDDRLDGGAAIDDLHGGNGNDEIFAGTGDVVRGGAGAQDRCGATNGQPDRLISCELSL